MEKCGLLWTKINPFDVLFTKTSRLTLQESEDHEIAAGSIPVEYNEKKYFGNTQYHFRGRI